LKFWHAGLPQERVLVRSVPAVFTSENNQLEKSIMYLSLGAAEDQRRRMGGTSLAYSSQMAGAFAAQVCEKVTKH
jgi:hypothetical protein